MIRLMVKKFARRLIRGPYNSYNITDQQWQELYRAADAHREHHGNRFWPAADTAMNRMGVKVKYKVFAQHYLHWRKHGTMRNIYLYIIVYYFIHI
jgi:hypothetical protein